MKLGTKRIKSDFLTARNHITAPLHTTKQVLLSVGRMIPFCIICGSHSSVEEYSNLLIYYIEETDKTLVMCQSSLLPQLKVKVSMCMS